MKEHEENFSIRFMQASDWTEVRAIYLEGIATKNATFQTHALMTLDECNEKYLPSCRLVAVSNNTVLGWVMLSSVSNRQVYAGVAEVSVYVAKTIQRMGIGYILLSALIRESEKHGFWTLQAGIFPENIASLALHKKCGFREVGMREKIAKLDGKWRDMLLLERRSNNFYA